MKPDWPAIKAEYVAGSGSLRDLANRYGVSFSTLGKRARREDWTGELATLGDAVATKVATTALQVATMQGQQLGMTAVALQTRTVLLLSRLLDEIDTKLQGPLTVGELRQLVAGWREITQVGREALGLDGPPEPTPAPRPYGVVLDLSFPPRLPSKVRPQLTNDPASDEQAAS